MDPRVSRIDGTADRRHAGDGASRVGRERDADRRGVDVVAVVGGVAVGGVSGKIKNDVAIFIGRRRPLESELVSLAGGAAWRVGVFDP